MNWFKYAVYNKIDHDAKILTNYFFKRIINSQDLLSEGKDLLTFSGENVPDSIIFVSVGDHEDIRVSGADIHYQDDQSEEIECKISLPYNFSSKYYSRLYFTLLGFFRHELEHSKQFSRMESEEKENRYSDSGGQIDLEYYISPGEVEAYVKSIYLQAKKMGRPFISVLDEYLNRIRDVVFSENRSFKIIKT